LQCDTLIFVGGKGTAENIKQIKKEDKYDTGKISKYWNIQKKKYLQVLVPVLVPLLLQEVSTVKLGRLAPALLTALMRNRGTDPLLSFKKAFFVLGL